MSGAAANTIVHWTAWTVFAFFFALVTVLGFVAARWKKADLDHLHEWGLGGRRFGTVITWFLLGGDMYTAYTMVAVPALVFAVGAYGFFAMPYTIVAFPIFFLLMPRLWNVCRRHEYVTLADFAQGRYGSHWLALAVALTGVLATMPYIALQLVGMQVVFAAMGFGALANGAEIALIVAFVVLALYTYTSGLRAPAMIAFVKDAMVYVFVIAAVIVIPAQLGGYGAVFAAASHAFAAKGGATGILLQPGQGMAFASLALGSAMALLLYPHTSTGVLAASSPDTLRRNAMLLPAYSVALGLIALMGYMAIAAHVDAKGTAVVPALILKSFPEWFAGFCFAAIALGALVPAAIMSIGAANLVTRNIWRPYVNRNMTAKQESTVAKVTSLVVKFGALLFVVFLPLEFAINLQLLGGIWMLQVFPAIVFGLYTPWFRANALLAGWAVGMTLGTALSWMQGVKPTYPVPCVGTVYIGMIALVANVLVAAMFTAVSDLLGRARKGDATAAGDYADARGAAG
ncbi:MAG TPA: sodium:solute symporter [Xanthomonadaceae bacterium]|jgi:SSS family solute:Na+ symporter|nr:sodium:solute symporter [Xanthomonadaceae bacterium]